MALPKPENQPYVIIFYVHNKQKKLPVCMENNSDIVCGVRPMMNDTPSTGKSTLCCNISTTQQTNKEKKNCIFAWKIILKLFYGVCPTKNDTHSTGKSTLCHNILITQQTKIFCFAWKTVYTRAGRALVRGIDGGQGRWPLAGVAPVSKKMFYHTIK